MQVEIWSDVLCPWCYIGKRRIEAALERFEGSVEVTWRSFELDPRAPQKADGSQVAEMGSKQTVPSPTPGSGQIRS